MLALTNNAAQNTTLYFIRQRATLLFPLIEPVLAQYGIPADFKFLPLAESALLNHAVSPKGAVGYWQLMPATARELGLRVNSDQDERRNLQKATVAVCRHLKRLHKRLHSWTLVAAAYNGGMARVRWQMKKQPQDSYYQLQLPHETSQYLFRVLAYKELLTNPEVYSPVLSSEVLTYLTCPLPVQACSIDKEGNLVTTRQQPDQFAAMAWGPRMDYSLLGALTETRQWLANAAGIMQAKNPGWTNEQAELPVKGMMCLMVLRFRRPRFLQRKIVLTRRAVLGWEWV
ncbi:hypothetical protein GCM10023189_46700 [Nibrella saemangeumensis]|uniref:Transglycosylase SLT domain-containing protein n=1 Tax=Nibrella saemangeumensis TaxID=1084526 RepID=A0ABP8NHW6_9BACT